MSTYARAPKSSTGTRVSTIAAARTPVAVLNHARPSAYTTHPSSASETYARPITAIAASSPCRPSTSSELSGDSAIAPSVASGCGVGAIATSRSGSVPCASSRPQTSEYSVS